MTEIRYDVEIAAAPDAVFAAIIDFHGYGRWLSTSSAFRGIRDISSNPVTLGTTWSEPSPNGTRHGRVTEFEPPTRVSFHQPMTMRPRLFGVIDIRVAISLTPIADGVRVRRLVTLGIPWQLRAVQPLVVRQFRAEMARTMASLKRTVERAG